MRLRFILRLVQVAENTATMDGQMSYEKDAEKQAPQPTKSSAVEADQPHREDIYWANSFYLGGAFAASTGDVVDIALAPENAFDLRSSIYNGSLAGPFRNTLARPFPSTFISWSPQAPKVCVLGNCQGPNIAKALNAVSRAPLSTCGLEIMAFSSNKASFFKAIDSADYIVACKTYSPEFEEINIEALNLGSVDKVG